MHREHGYTPNYLDGWNLLPLEDDLSGSYAPVIEEADTNLYVAWQWKVRDEDYESAVSSHSEVTGLTYSTFRHDNPGPIARGDWWI